MPDNAWQSDTMHAHYGMLSTRYMHDPHAFVGMNLLLLYDREDEARDMVAPDVFVVFGVPDKKRASYNVREEGKAPDFVLEAASKGTYENDLGSKKDKYEGMGVPEYCVVDPKGGMHRPRLQLFRLEGGVYKPVSGRSGPDGSLAVTSETLGLELRLEDDRLRLWDPETQDYLRGHQEEHVGRLKERAGRLKERTGRLKERTGRLKERTGRLKERAGRLKERARYEEERARHLEERDKRIAAEQRVLDLESQLADPKERRPEQR